MLLNVFRVLAEQTTPGRYATAYHSWVLNTTKQRGKRAKAEGKLTRAALNLAPEVGWKGESEVRCLSTRYAQLRDAALLKMLRSIRQACSTVLGNTPNRARGKIRDVPTRALYNAMNDLSTNNCM